jgi:replication initiation and membrane attachment protein
MKLNDIYLERKKLEGIGLLKTYKKENEQYRLFIYELQPPLKPETFFEDDVLNIYLYSRLGKQKFLEVRNKFIKPAATHSDFEVVTASFNDAFESVHQSELMTKRHSEIDETLKIKDDEQFVQRESASDLVFYSSSFDFDLLLQDLKAFILPKELITDEIKACIIRLAFVYSIDPLEMSSILQQAYMNEGELTPNFIRKAVQDWYKFEYPKDLPALSERTQPLPNQMMRDKEPKTPQEKVVKHFETVSPRQLLEGYSDGSKPAAADLKLVESIMLDQKLNPGVTNVLIDYVLKTNDMKLIKSYVEKIASHWKRKNITTVVQAMALAKSEHQKYQEWTTNKAKSQSAKGSPRKNPRVDKLPEWMDNNTAKANKVSPEKAKTDNKAQVAKKDDQAKKWLEDYIKGL